MSVTNLRPDMGSLAGQIDALDRGLLEIAAENRRLRKRVDGLMAQIAVLAAAQAPADSERGLHLAWSAR